MVWYGMLVISIVFTLVPETPQITCTKTEYLAQLESQPNDGSDVIYQRTTCTSEDVALNMKIGTPTHKDILQSIRKNMSNIHKYEFQDPKFLAFEPLTQNTSLDVSVYGYISVGL